MKNRQTYDYLFTIRSELQNGHRFDFGLTFFDFVKESPQLLQYAILYPPVFCYKILVINFFGGFFVIEEKHVILQSKISFSSESGKCAIKGTSNIYRQSEHCHVGFSFSILFMNFD
jgi:hypothetical protein